jgi:hypothetical protein
MGDRSEKVGVATAAWRARASAKFDELGRGSKSDCAKAIKCSRAAITRVLKGGKGGTASSEVVNKVSDWLKIPRPGYALERPELVRLQATAEQLDAESLVALQTMADALVRNLPH